MSTTLCSRDLTALRKIRTLPELLTQHLARAPERVLYRVYDALERDWQPLTAADVARAVAAWRRAFAAVGDLHRGDRMAMLLPNSIEAVYFDQSVLANAMIPVPLHAVDTPNSSAFILKDAGAKVLVTNKLLKWKQIREVADFPDLKLVVITDDANCDDLTADIPVMTLESFLARGEGRLLPADQPMSEDLAAIVYTSGTTGNPKGVMLTHVNVLANVRAIIESVPFGDDETWLSFLPFSHTLERTTSYYISLALGHTTAFNRSIATLAEDIRTVRPTCLMAVPRVYEMIHQKFKDQVAKKGEVAEHLFNWVEETGWRRFARENGLSVEEKPRAMAKNLVADLVDDRIVRDFRALFGDRTHILFSGGAPLNPSVSKTFAAFGMPILQGYGLTETSPAISVGRVGANDPTSVGKVLPSFEVRLGDGGELQVRGPSVMVGYWHREEATAEVLSADGWFKTGDVAEIDERGLVRITGRIKEIIVTSTGEKVPPADLEAAIESDRLFSQSLVLGDNRPFIAALAVVNPDAWGDFCTELDLDPKDPASLSDPRAVKAALRRIRMATADFPNYGIPRQVALVSEPWTVDNGLLTPTMKKKRRLITEKHSAQIDLMYEALSSKKTSESGEKGISKLKERVRAAVRKKESRFCRVN